MRCATLFRFTTIALLLGWGSLAEAQWHLMRDDYGFGIRPGSELRKPINRALAALLHEPIWQRIRDRYLGESDG